MDEEPPLPGTQINNDHSKSTLPSPRSIYWFISQRGKVVDSLYLFRSRHGFNSSRHLYLLEID